MTTMATTIEEIDPFEMALRIRQEQQNKQNTKQSVSYVSNNNREEIPWYGLEYGQETVIRILGNPAEYRTENWHSKFIFYCELVTDNRKRYTDIIWKTKQDYDNKSISVLDEDWVLHKLYNMTFKKAWVNLPFIDKYGKQQKGRYEYDYQDTEIYKILFNNNLNLSKDAKLFPKKVKPQKRTLLPVLIRNEGSSEIKVLTTKYSSKDYTDKQGEKRIQIYCDFGIPVSETDDRVYLYNLICQKISDKYNTWNFDIVIKKTKITDIQIQYDIYPCFSTEVSSFSKSLVSVFPKMREVQKVNNQGVLETLQIPENVPLTPQEQALEKPNLDKLFPETSYEKLHLFHKELFLLADKTFRSNFYDELVANLKMENPEAASKVEATKVTLPVTETVQSVVTETVQSPIPSRRTAVATQVTQSGVSLLDQCKTVFKSWESLNEVEKQTLLSTVDFFDDGVPKFKKEFGNQILACGCGKKFNNLSTGQASESDIACHTDILTCPMCATNLT